MRESTLHRNGTCDAPDNLTALDPLQEPAGEPAGLLPTVPRWTGGPPPLAGTAPSPPALTAVEAKAKEQPTLAIFCYESPHSLVGSWVDNVISALARRDVAVHLYSRQPFAMDVKGVSVHAVGGRDEDDLLAQVQDFTSRACSSFLREFPPGSDAVSLLGCEWSSVPVLSLLQGTGGNDMLLSFHSLERQRSDLSADISREIEAIERVGLAEAKTIFLHQQASSRAARELLPDCAGKLVSGRPDFPPDEFEGQLDPGVVKARYLVGPVDPTILYVGDLDERHGADVLVKSMPAILKNHKQARLIVVGDGTLLWPLKVYARYLLLEHAVRLVGHVEGRALGELIQAADIVAVPSREATEWWPIQAAWAARRPVVASHEMVAGLGLENEKDAVLVYPHESSCVWGIERLLFDPELGQAIGRRGREKVEERFGWSTVAARIEQAMMVEVVH